MKKISVAEAAEFYGVSKEAIHNRIRRGSLNSELSDGQKYVVIDEDATPPTKGTKKTTTKTTSRARNATQIDSKYYKHLEDQNHKLQEKVEVLESETRTLRDQKEQMLIDERIKIENIYKEKDEQLKSIINMISSNLMIESKVNIEDELVEAEIEEVEENWTSLNKFLKSLNYKKLKRQRTIKKFYKRAKKGDESIMLKDDKCYIDLNRFGYDL